MYYFSDIGAFTQLSAKLHIFFIPSAKILHYLRTPPSTRHPQGKKCAPLHVTNMRSIRISASGGDDDRRRAFPPPRQAVAAVRNPVFSHAGSWRHAGRAKSLDLNRTPEVVRGCASAVVRYVSSCVPHGCVVQ